jgi:hypothetical protein
MIPEDEITGGWVENPRINRAVSAITSVLMVFGYGIMGMLGLTALVVAVLAAPVGFMIAGDVLIGYPETAADEISTLGILMFLLGVGFDIGVFIGLDEMTRL